MINWNENPYVARLGCHYSRIIASWANYGNGYFEREFEEWLKTLEFTEEEIREIVERATCGKFELERSIIKFKKEHPELFEE